VPGESSDDATGRDQLRRDCSDALKALQRDRSAERIPTLAEALRTLGPPYRLHGELMYGALRDEDDNTITWHLIHVLEKLEKDAP
jgi:hypothetical protein